MSATKETGHARNIANFNQVISICNRIGTAYQPVNEDLKITRMQLLYNASDESKNALATVLPNYSLAVTNRETAFDALPKLVTRIVAYLVATGVNSGIIKDVKSISRTINSTYKKAATTTEGDEEETTDANTVSNSHKSYDNLVSNFFNLIQLLKAIPEYAPMESDIKTSLLTSFHDMLKALNNNVVTTTQPVASARKLRDSYLYTKEYGVVDTYKKVKAYVKAIKGIKSDEYKDLVALKFTKPRKIDPNLNFTLIDPA